ncbi:MAG: hypothetical protein K8I82_06965 [Anaerolineae bacterium]|nr:hypothetical protein [Anaerolineae bacterium]
MYKTDTRPSPVLGKGLGWGCPSSGIFITPAYSAEDDFFIGGAEPEVKRIQVGGYTLSYFSSDMEYQYWEIIALPQEAS